MITQVFEKALGDLFFQDMYAELCSLLASKSAEWCQGFLQVADKRADCGDAGVTNDGWYFTACGEGEQIVWTGPFESEDVARSQGSSQTSFKRLLLNKCQQQFMLVRGLPSAVWFTPITSSQVASCPCSRACESVNPRICTSVSLHICTVYGDNACVSP